jgi:hypothetical protein
MARPTNAEIERRRLEAGDTVPETPAPVAVEASGLDLSDDIARIAAMRAQSPFGAFDRKLDLAPIEGYKLHWFNDKPGRIERALSAGWTYILNDAGKPKSQIVDSGGLKSFAMKIPEQFWAEDQRREQGKAEAALSAVKKKPTGQVPGQNQANDAGNFYTPNASGEAAVISRSNTR